MIRNLATTVAVSSAFIAVLAVKPDNYRSRGNDHDGQQVMLPAESDSTVASDKNNSTISSTLSSKPIEVTRTTDATIEITGTDAASGQATWTITQPEFVIDPSAIVDATKQADGGKTNDRTNLLFAMVKNLGDKMRIVLNFINNQHKCANEISKNHDEFTSSVLASDTKFSAVDQIIDRATREARNTTVFGKTVDEKDEILASVKGVVLQGEQMYNCGPGDHVVYAQYLNKVTNTELKNQNKSYGRYNWKEGEGSSDTQWTKWNVACKQGSHQAPYTAEECRLIKEGINTEFPRATLYEVLMNAREHKDTTDIQEFTDFELLPYTNGRAQKCSDHSDGMFSGKDPAKFRLKQCICTSLNQKKLVALEQKVADAEAAATATTTAPK